MRRLWEKNGDRCEGGEKKGNVDKVKGDYGNRIVEKLLHINVDNGHV